MSESDVLRAREQMLGVLESFRPSRYRFFPLLKAADPTRVRSARFLDELYVRYQAAMHATRVMVYYLPGLDEIGMRVRKCAIISDDDHLPDGDSHHVQLRETWTTMLGRPPSAPDSFFGSLDELARSSDAGTGRFISFIHREYARTLGPWVVIEGLADDWIRELCEALRPHFPGVESSRYFVANLASGVEKEHASVAFDLFSEVIEKRPAHAEECVRAAHATGAELELFWDECCRLLE